MKKWITLGAALCLALSVFDRVMARTPQEKQPQRGDEVKIVPNGQRAGAAPGQKGSTYYSLENQATRVTTSFADGMTATSDRSFDGDVMSTLRDAIGREIHRVRVDRKDGVNDLVQFLRPQEEAVQAVLDPAVKPTLDWANRQGHLLHGDRVTSGAGLRWRDGVMRPDRAEPEADELATVKSIETRWPNGLAAKTRRVPSKSTDLFEGKPVRGDVLVTTLTRDNVVIGTANYLTFERVYIWRIAGLTEGVIANEHMKQKYGGWLFRPDMAWMNLQLLGMYQWKSEIRDKGFVNGPGTIPAPTIASRIANFFAPTVQANESGCDGLHWLDGTNFRYCCDVHDYCFEKNGCNSSSWWQVWSSWRCDRCNIQVVWCFSSGGGGRGPIII